MFCCIFSVLLLFDILLLLFRNSFCPWLSVINSVLERVLVMDTLGFDCNKSVCCSTSTSHDVVATKTISQLTLFPYFPFFAVRKSDMKKRILLWWAISRWFPPRCGVWSDHTACWWTGEGLQRPGSSLLWRLLRCLEQRPSEERNRPLIVSDHWVSTT